MAVGEVCNNGVDDDHDGLVDGVLFGADPCAVAARARDAPWPTDARYAFALDLEEVSHRAWLQCVQTGCCQAASGGLARRAEMAQNARPNSQRPPAERLPQCEGPPEVSAEADGAALERVLDLPVTGVSWCQARDFCHWAGKRLATEFEHTFVAAGEAPLRDTPWGGSLDATCAEAQACKTLNCAPGDPACETLPACTGLTPPAPATQRAACWASFASGVAGCDAHDIPTPVWSNEDGATSAGALNLVGNVAEWTYDWSTPAAGPLATDSAVGPACGADAVGRIDRRIAHGGHLASSGSEMAPTQREGHAPAWRSALVGFRCGRTLDEGGARCTDGIPNVRAADAACQPPPLPLGQVDVPCGPDFGGVGAFEPDATVCGGARVETDTCAASVSRLCPTIGGAGCNALAVDSLALSAAGQIRMSDAESRNLQGLLELGLAPKGGESYLLLSGPADFGVPGPSVGVFGSALRVGGALRWTGTVNGIGCDATPRAEDLALTVAEGGGLSTCGTHQAGELWFQDVPIRLRYSAMSLDGHWDAPSEHFTGRLALVITRADAGVSVLGGEPLTDVIARTNAGPTALCDSAALGLPGCTGQTLELPTCDLDPTCADPENCTGWTLVFNLGAVRVARGVEDAVLPVLECP